MNAAALSWDLCDLRLSTAQYSYNSVDTFVSLLGLVPDAMSVVQAFICQLQASFRVRSVVNVKHRPHTVTLAQHCCNHPAPTPHPHPPSNGHARTDSSRARRISWRSVILDTSGSGSAGSGFFGGDESTHSAFAYAQVLTFAGKHAHRPRARALSLSLSLSHTLTLTEVDDMTIVDKTSGPFRLGLGRARSALARRRRRPRVPDVRLGFGP